MIRVKKLTNKRNCLLYLFKKFFNFMLFDIKIAILFLSHDKHRHSHFHNDQILCFLTISVMLKIIPGLKQIPL